MVARVKAKVGGVQVWSSSEREKGREWRCTTTIRIRGLGVRVPTEGVVLRGSEVKGGGSSAALHGGLVVVGGE
jgi:hypothetical protein